MTATTPQHSGCTLRAYADAIGLRVDWLEAIGTRQVRRAYRPAVEVSHYHRDGSVGGRSICCGVPGADTDGIWDYKTAQPAYGVHTLGNQGSIYLVGSIVDAQTLHAHELPAIAIPTMSWDAAMDALLVSLRTIIVVILSDGDELTVPRSLEEASWRDRARLLVVEHPMWINARHQEDDAQFAALMEQIANAAMTWGEYEGQRATARRKAAIARCRALADEPDILACVDRDAEAGGYAGDTRSVRLIFLALISCLLERPVSIAMKGVSSAGKTFAVVTALKFVPATAYHTLTSMSEKALIYDSEPIRHRALVVYEAPGLGGFAEMIVRSLISEDHIVYKTVQEVDGVRETVTIERDGPTGLITTTTNIRLHHENETRLFSDTVPDAPDQTARILDAEAARAEGTASTGSDYAEYHALHEFLAAGGNAVVIPYARRLATSIPPVAVRLRRDFRALLSLIMAHALLHQRTREQDARGRVVATLDDYAAVHGLVASLFSEGVERTVPAQIRETVDAVRQAGPAAVAGGDGITLSEVRDKLAQAGVVLDRSSVLRRVTQAVAMGCLVDLSGGRQGRAKRLVMGEMLDTTSGEADVLPMPDVLAELAADMS